MEVCESVGQAAEEGSEQGEHVAVACGFVVVFFEVAVTDGLHYDGEAAWVGVTSDL